MCLIAAIPQAAKLDLAKLENAFARNRDGFGVAWTHQGKIHVHKNHYATFGPIAKVLRAADAQRDRGMVVHFRYATHGTVDKGNCHPFYVHPKLVVAHNGIFRNLPDHPTLSDTQVFVESVLKKLPKDFLSNAGITALLSQYVASQNSKLAFLDAEGRPTVINHQAGIWVDKVWYSNAYSLEGRASLPKRTTVLVQREEEEDEDYRDSFLSYLEGPRK